MRATFAVLMMVAWPALAAAQSTLAPLPPLPPIGLPLPQITAPLTPIALTPPEGVRPPQTDGRRPRPRPHFDGKHRPAFQWPIIYFVDRYYFPMSTEAHTRSPLPADYSSGGAQETRPIEASVQAPAAPPSAQETSETEPAPPAPPPPSTFYYIPGCYIGNVPPSEVVLPANCDRTRMITRSP